MNLIFKTDQESKIFDLLETHFFDDITYLKENIKSAIEEGISKGYSLDEIELIPEIFDHGNSIFTCVRVGNQQIKYRLPSSFIFVHEIEEMKADIRKPKEIPDIESNKALRQIINNQNKELDEILFLKSTLRKI